MTNPIKKSSFNRKFDRNSHDRGPRRNERIRVPEVRVIDPNGNQLGIMDTREALAYARSLKLDLIEVAASSNPPVCRILDYGRFKYEEGKKTKGQQKSNAVKVKEIKFHPNVDVGDYDTKIRRGKEFLQSGCKVKISLMFRGREMAYQDLGFKVVQRAINDLQEDGSLDSPAKMSGRTITASLSPRTKVVKKKEAPSENQPPPDRD